MSITIAFIGRKTHEKTRSDVYLIDLMVKLGGTTVFRREDFSNKELVDEVNSIEPDVVIFFQERPSVTHHLRKIKCKNVLWLPMWDGFEKLGFRKRLAYRGSKIKAISHCRKVHSYLNDIGIKSLYSQYYLSYDFKQQYNNAPPYTFLLWQRCSSINVEYLTRIVGSENIGKIIYKGEKADLKIPDGVHVEVVDSWLEEGGYAELLKSADYFVAPRRIEGIGMSFIKALSLGVPVIAFDEATMNEYIIDGVNGHLCTEEKLPCLKSPLELSEGLQQNYIEGYTRWCDSENELVDFIINT